MTRQDAINEVTRRLVEFYKPDRIDLFGSAARGDDRPDSDLDFLVAVPDGTPTEKLRGGGIYPSLMELDVAVDIVPWRRTDFEGRAAHVRASLPATVVREGRIVYDAELASFG